MNSKSLSIYISSGDKFEWLWRPFFYYFDKYWPDCPYMRYLGTESKNYSGSHSVITLNSGSVKTWGESITKNLSKLNTKYILFLLDDYFLQKKVDTALIDKVLEVAESVEAKYVKLTEIGLPQSPPLSKVDIHFLPIVEADIYVTPLQAAIWNRDFFLKVLNPLESPWDFERNVKCRLDSYTGIYYLEKQAFKINFGGVMHYGLMERRFARRISKDGIEISKEHVMTSRQQTAKYLEDVITKFRLHKLIPTSLRNFIKKFLT